MEQGPGKVDMVRTVALQKRESRDCMDEGWRYRTRLVIQAGLTAAADENENGESQRKKLLLVAKWVGGVEMAIEALEQWQSQQWTWLFGWQLDFLAKLLP